MTEKITIGWQEWGKLPKLDILGIKIKVDTGAQTSSLHAENIKQFKKNGVDYVSFEVHPIQKDKKTVVHCEAELIDLKLVKSSSGCKQYRPVITTTLQIGLHHYKIALNLTKRDHMGYRMLLGREAMEGRMLIDPESSFVHGKRDVSELKKQYISHKLD